ncbi:MAG TPA: thioredoxin domain-containing protein [Pyrinomonadaceae bacterium]|nr:thioredoxin domain-containing protein [Pyrinomonadaceae bacterium]
MAPQAPQVKPKSSAPIFIIGGVLIAVVLVGWYLISNRTPTTGNNNARPTAGNTNKPPVNPATAPAGAMPTLYAAGGQNAAVVVEEFADFQCAACAGANPVMNEIKSMYGSRIKFVFRNFPLSIPAHDKAYDAAVAVEAAGMQNKFWEFQSQLFNNQKDWSSSPNYRQMWSDYAKNLGLNVDKFTTDMAGLATKGRVNDDMARGRGLGVSSTPSVFINGVLVDFNSMTVSGLKTAIDAELAKGSAPSAPASASPASK